MKDKSTGLADIQALLSQAAAASVPLKQSNIVLSKISSRERHLMNPHQPLYTPNSAGQGTRCFWAGRSATATERAKTTVRHFVLEQTWFQVTHKPTNNPSPPQLHSVVPSSGPDTSTMASVKKQHLKLEAFGLKSSNTVELRCLHALACVAGRSLRQQSCTWRPQVTTCPSVAWNKSPAKWKQEAQSIDQGVLDDFCVSRVRKLPALC